MSEILIWFKEYPAEIHKESIETGECTRGRK